MADTRKIRVMVSSRSLSPVFGGTPLGEVRKRLQALLHDIRWCASSSRVGRDQALFDVWIHENDVGRPATGTTLQMSLEEIRKADIIVALYTGEAGSAETDAEMGICYAELQQALTRRPDIVAVVALPPDRPGKLLRYAAFQAYVKNLSVPRSEVKSEPELHARVTELLQQLISMQVGRGATVGTRKRDRGQALDWNSLDLEARREAMRAVLAQALQAKLVDGESDISLHAASLGGRVEVGVRLDAIAAAWSVAVARERVGQPFLNDHRFARVLAQNDLPGPVHVIACHRGVTENQAMRMLGTPDAIGVTGDFGVYVADHVQQIQMVFLAQCADEGAVALAVRQLREWLRLPGPGVRLLARATSRRAILDAIGAEQRKLERSPRGARSSKERR